MAERGYDAETALEVTLEHLYANSQDFDLTDEEWDTVIGKLEKFGRTLNQVVSGDFRCFECWDAVWRHGIPLNF